MSTEGGTRYHPCVVLIMNGDQSSLAKRTDFLGSIERIVSSFDTRQYRGSAAVKSIDPFFETM